MEIKLEFEAPGQLLGEINMPGFVYIQNASFMIVDEVIDRRIDEALENVQTLKKSTSTLKAFLCQKIGPRIGVAGFPALFRIPEICLLADRCEKTVRIWLKELERVGIISTRRVGPGKIKILLQPDFAYTGPFPDELNDYIDEYAYKSPPSRESCLPAFLG